MSPGRSQNDVLQQAAATAIEAVPTAEMEERLAWKPRLLEFDEASLAEIVAEFNRRNPVRIEIADPALRSDNVEGFVRMLEADFGVATSRPQAGVIALRARR